MRLLNRLVQLFHTEEKPQVAGLCLALVFRALPRFVILRQLNLVMNTVAREHPADYEIAHDASFEQHLNKYHVISLDVTSFASEAEVEGIPLCEVPASISLAVHRGAAVSKN